MTKPDHGFIFRIAGYLLSVLGGGVAVIALVAAILAVRFLTDKVKGRER